MSDNAVFVLGAGAISQFGFPINRDQKQLLVGGMRLDKVLGRKKWQIKKV